MNNNNFPQNSHGRCRRAWARWRIRIVALLVLAVASIVVQAAPTAAPSLPLPPCTLDANGNQQGACTNNSDGFSVDAAGRLGEGASVNLYGNSGIPACVSFSDNGMTWSPSPCYSKASLNVTGYNCYYIDLRDEKFKLGNCLNVLYKDASAAGAPYSPADLIDLENPKGGASCQGSGDFYTYFYGGPGNVEGARWSERAPDAVRCKATFEGPRPDGMYGPTWLIGSFSVQEEYTGNGFRGGRNDHHTYNTRSAKTFIPIDGDLRDLGVIAAFNVETTGREASFDNQSRDTDGGSLTYEWRFGDGKTATDSNPSHVYDAAGTYTVRLTARDNDGNEASTSKQIEVEAALVVELTTPEPIPKVGEQAQIQVDLHNYETSDISNLSLTLEVDTAHVKKVGFPPKVPSSLAKNASTTVNYNIEALAAGETEFDANAEGRTIEGRTVSDSDSGSIRIPVNIELELSSAVTSDSKAKPKVGDDIQFTLRLTNNEDQTLTGITVEPLGISPNELLSTVSGPTTQDGNDPRVNRLSLAPGESTTVTFVYHAEQEGVVNVSAFVAGKNPSGDGIFTADTQRNVGIQAGGDVAVSVEANLDQADFDNGRLFASYDVTIDNVGDADAENLELTAAFPNTVLVQSVTEPQCRLPGVAEGETPPANALRKIGGQLQCKFDGELAVDSSRQFTVKARILNATDLAALQSGVALQNFGNASKGVKFEVSADDDIDTFNNETLAKVDIPFRTGSFEQTRAAMDALAPYFNYKTDKLSSQCNVYKDDIFSRLETIRRGHPEVFAQLAYGGITSGEYLVPGLTTVHKAGHVGVVVYTKGTDYRKTGIIINGTPTPSPLNLHSQIGPDDQVQADPSLVGGWTAFNGLYLRTAADQFPGTPQQEGIGLEGRYEYNQAEFTYGGSAPTQAAPVDATACPFAPDAMTVMTQSPVDLRVTNDRGQQVETSGGQIVRQDLDTGIVAMAFPHEDGTFSWLLDLPRDDYSIELLGIGTGPYTLTRTRFRADGTPVDTVVNGQTQPGQLGTFEFAAAPAAGEPGNGDPGGGDSAGPGTREDGSRVRAGHGGCSMSTTPGAPDPTLPLLALLAGLVLLRRRVGQWLLTQDCGRPWST